MPTLASCLTFKIYVHYRYALYFSKVVLFITELLQSSNDLQWENICLHARNYIFTILSNLAKIQTFRSIYRQCISIKNPLL